eukprot:TRINITY_DN106669_c0_g1_i1.p1 TRINITY_DN106669_c0_g1~~TRINITY_DN106669_c0_g1_i1.p1  ORF type:complete len:362 (-),score=74.09 TRINITY_DN106669_c0_g1_i1:86-1171(-)
MKVEEGDSDSYSGEPHALGPHFHHISEVLVQSELDYEISCPHVVEVDIRQHLNSETACKKSGPSGTSPQLFVVTAATGVLLRKGIEMDSGRVGVAPFGAICAVVGITTAVGGTLRAKVASWRPPAGQRAEEVQMEGWCTAKLLQPLQPDDAQNPAGNTWKERVVKTGKETWEMARPKLAKVMDAVEADLRKDFQPVATEIASLFNEVKDGVNDIANNDVPVHMPEKGTIPKGGQTGWSRSGRSKCAAEALEQYHASQDTPETADTVVQDAQLPALRSPSPAKDAQTLKEAGARKPLPAEASPFRSPQATKDAEAIPHYPMARLATMEHYDVVPKAVRLPVFKTSECLARRRCDEREYRVIV